jgi:hypothetical protein
MDRLRTLFRAIVATALVAGPSALTAQETGRVVGRVVESGQGSPLSGARVEVTGTGIAATTAIDGRFSLANIPAGAVSLSVRLIGFQPKVVTGLTVATNATIEQNVSLTPSVVQLEEVAVTAEVERGTVAAALEEQRYAPNLVNAITAEQIAKTPDTDAAAAVQRVSGVSVQDGRYVIVRGMGERYTTASLNGSRLPSPEPEKRQVPFDLFPSSVIEGITTSKTFTPDQPGDFSGGQVNIKTKEFPSRRTATLSIGTGLNAAAVGSGNVNAPRVTGDLVAAGASRREIPANVPGTDFNNLSQTQTNEIVNSFRNVWSPRQVSGTPNASFALNVGGTDRVFGQDVGYIASGSYGYNSDVLDEQSRGLAIARAEGQAEQADLYEGQTGRYSVLWGGLVNLTTNLGSHSQLALNTNYNRTMDSEARTEFGQNENLGTNLLISRLRYVERSVFSTALNGQHELGRRNLIQWTGSYSNVNRLEPDRSEIVYAPQSAGGELGWFGGSNEAAVRTFAALDERAAEGRVNYTYLFGNADGRTALQVGGLIRNTTRDANNDVYSISSRGNLNDEELRLQPEQIFDGRFSQGSDDNFAVTPLGQGGSYGADETITAGFAMVTVPISSRLSIIGGARVENWDLTVDAVPTLGAPETVVRNQTDILPALSATYRLTEDQNLRFAVSRTLSRPEYRELAEIQFRDVIGFDNIRGNRDLQRATIDNIDVRWELFPTPSEVLSIGVFAKRFTDPIERVYVATSGTRIITFVNATGGDNLGVELEARKNLRFLSSSLVGFTGFANVTLMSSQVRIDNASEASITNTERKMVGQSPYVVNLGTTWTSPSGAWSATLLYNVFGERIVEAAEVPLPDVVEEPRHMIDFSLRFPISGGLLGKVDARNLLNAPYRRFQGDVVRERYVTGRIFSLGLTWQL